MKIRYLIAASAAALTAASSAQAADVVANQEPAPVVAAPAFSWTGFYAGAQIGGSWSDTDLKGKYKGQGDAWSRRQGFSPDPSGFIGGIYAGYNYDLGNNIIIGADTDWVWGDMDESDKRNVTYSDGATGSFHGKLKEQWAGSTRARVGYAVDRWMPYIAGGVAYAKVDSSFRLKDANGKVMSGYSASDSDTLVGWTIGAGFDYAMTDHIILRAEYRYTDFGDEDYSKNNVKYNVDYKTNDFRVGVAYKF
ncbi:outer membrane protein [uncultured Bartonella sp.]|uniref:outer membrane protein n=1 Tax=uncultured Bartonella sp. TaxID=104108 RepID=UPI0025ECAA5B|nr:outer membrane protein [uncultured Bartonella sp.]